MKTDKTKGTICSITSALVFGITPVLASMSFALGSNAMTLTFYRNAIGIPALLAMLLFRRVSLKITREDVKSLLLVSLLFSVTTTYILYAAYDYIGVGLATTLHFLYPVVTVVFDRLFFKDKISGAKTVALILATLGIALASGGSNSFALVGIILAVGSAVTYAGYLIGIERTSIKQMDPMKSMFYMCVINCIACGLFDLPTGDIVYALPPKAMLFTTIVSLANSAFAYVLLIVGVKLIGAGNAAILSMLEPVSGVAAGVFFLGESLPLVKIISCGLILLAVLIPIRQNSLQP